MFGATVDVVTSTSGNQRTFTVHSNVVTTRSSFFAARLKDTWSRANEPVQLLDEDADIFDAYLTVLYRNEAKFTDKDHGALSGDEMEALHDLHSKVYILSDKLGDCKSANLVIDSLIEFSVATSSEPPMRVMTHIYENTTPTSPFRQFCAQHVAHYMRWTGITVSMREHAPRDLLLDILVERELLADKDPGAMERKSEFFRDDMEALKLRYHQHDSLHPRQSGQEAEEV